MANTSVNLDAFPRPLTVADAAGLEASVKPQLWAPSLIMETNFATPSTFGGLAADADILRLNVIPTSAMPNYVFYPIAMRYTFINTGPDSTFGAFWEIGAAVAIEGIFDDGQDEPWKYYSFDLDGAFRGFHAGGEFFMQSGTPEFKGFPPKLPLADSSGPVENALGSALFTVKTFDATALSNMSLHVDARWLAFPRPVLKSAGFYQPRLWFKPG